MVHVQALHVAGWAKAGATNALPLPAAAAAAPNESVPPLTASLPALPLAPRPRGFGTVRFTTREDAEAAIEKLNNSDFEGRTITVRLDRYA
jgi:hypothetical protein